MLPHASIVHGTWAKGDHMVNVASKLKSFNVVNVRGIDQHTSTMMKRIITEKHMEHSKCAKV